MASAFKDRCGIKSGFRLSNLNPLPQLLSMLMATIGTMATDTSVATLVLLALLLLSSSSRSHLLSHLQWLSLIRLMPGMVFTGKFNTTLHRLGAHKCAVVGVEVGEGMKPTQMREIATKTL